MTTVTENAGVHCIPGSLPLKCSILARETSTRKLFSGTPYGNVDILPWRNDYSKYEALVLLGWNTMCDEMLEKLKQYVFDGGTLYISYCHFNTTDRNDRPQVFVPSDRIEEFAGLKLRGFKYPAGSITFTGGFNCNICGGDDNPRLVECEAEGASVVAWDENGTGVFFKNRYGNGTVYFGAFADYFHHDWAVSCHFTPA